MELKFKYILPCSLAAACNLICNHGNTMPRLETTPKCKLWKPHVFLIKAHYFSTFTHPSASFKFQNRTSTFFSNARRVSLGSPHRHKYHICGLAQLNVLRLRAMEPASLCGQVFQGHPLCTDVLVADSHLCQLLLRHEGPRIRSLWVETCE